MEKYPQGVVDITVEISELLGAETNIYTSMDGNSIIAAVPSRDDLVLGQSLALAINVKKAHLFDVETELNILTPEDFAKETE